MPSLPSIFDQCKPRPEVRAGELPDAIFAADLWEVFCQQAHRDYQDPVRFFAGTHPTENLKLLVKEVTERLAGVEGGAPIFRLETGFGGGKSHALIATVHAVREGNVWRSSCRIITSIASLNAAQLGSRRSSGRSPIRYAGRSMRSMDSRSASILLGDKSPCWLGASPGTIKCARTTSKALFLDAESCGRPLATAPS
jgi:hypothetical protein